MRLLAAMLFAGAASVAAEPAIVLSSEATDDQVVVTASAQSDVAFKGTLVLEVRRIGQSGVLTSRQSAPVNLPEGGETVAARTGFSFRDGGEGMIIANLYRDADQLISTSELILKSTE